MNIYKIIYFIISLLFFYYNVYNLKKRNIFLHESNNQILIKIGDVGLSKEIDLALYTDVGTFGYMSPQIVNKQKYTEKTDVWYAII